MRFYDPSPKLFKILFRIDQGHAPVFDSSGEYTPYVPRLKTPLLFKANNIKLDGSHNYYAIAEIQGLSLAV